MSFFGSIIDIFTGDAFSAVQKGVSSIYQGYQTVQAAKNAKRAEKLQQADEARQIEETRRQSKRLANTQRVNFLNNGIALDGTAALLIEETENLGEEDALNLLNHSRQRARTSRQRRHDDTFTRAFNTVGNVRSFVADTGDIEDFDWFS